ncbi:MULTISPECIES: hypothetical protein [Arthrobacter]|uniref:Uncharacterized protein n=1 Tax=Arthrobacter terricola TaxID=2547396 RepID=A0A4R5KM02_9MICC|nr:MULTISPECIES: hypothetical protein [Arthrobacter]MBT8161446.1 hypothetical protein [Arthrobacter sp. GN70]TDF95617.1 hypothetical protein E1809_11360 [Arthrobacter terricola]
MSKRVIIAATAAFIAGIALAPVAASAMQKVFDSTLTPHMDISGTEDVRRFDDDKFQVKCWLYEASGGISCLPWDEAKER